MTASDLHEAGSAIEAAVAMNPGASVKIDPLKLARMLMWAASKIREQDKREGSTTSGNKNEGPASTGAAA